jgi:hypothetical protein
MQRALLCLALTALLAPVSTLAAQGKAVWVDASCKYFIADLGGEFGFYHWTDGEPPREGDVLDGEVKSPGRVELVNTTSGGKNGVVAMAISPTMHSLIHSSPVECKRRWQK